MPYAGNVEPYDLEHRGIERLSVVYGVVPVHADGRAFKQYRAFDPRDPGEHPESDTPRKVAKGVVERIGDAEAGIFNQDVKVSWQPKPIGRTALSRGVGRWTYSTDIFTAGEILGAAASDVIEANVYGDLISEYGRGLILPAPEDITDQLDELVDSELGNTMLRGLLARHSEERHDQADAIRQI